jgi:manganese/zinc/iron transport system permease protein
MYYNTIIVLLGVSLLGACAGLVGCFAVLRRRALTGDALGHAALPGLCVAFLLFGELGMAPMLAGALASGVLGVAVISALRRWTRIKEDAAIGIVLGVFFGVGAALSKIIQRLPLSGRSGLESYIFGKTAGMLGEDLYWIAGLSLLCLAAVLVLYKEFKLIAFDPDFGRAQGWPSLLLDLGLMALVAVTVVVGLPVVGVLLIAALLIIPAAAARFWTERLGLMAALSALIGAGAGAAGARVSSVMDLPAGPAIVLSATAVFLASALLAPRRGVLARYLAHRRFRRDLAAGRIG